MAPPHIETHEVYPRVCGGTRPAQRAPLSRRGLSPRVRGNHGSRSCGLPDARSIPACAGEPPSRPARRAPSAVYPRVCGGTVSTPWPAWCRCGLSPRVRGNPPLGSGQAWPGRSIPACAGEPILQSSQSMNMRVYPRVCGGTTIGNSARCQVVGLSPRVRGNRGVAGALRGHIGSIPACAGEPGRCPAPRGRGTVYPRVCGGTANVSHVGEAVHGLSPRVRGNRPDRHRHSAANRSIPACAGEPADELLLLGKHQVYPRVCGGTHVAPSISTATRGLSPRVRGNPLPCNNSISIRDTCMPRMRIQLYLIRYTPSASTISFGASPSVRIRCSPAADGSRQVMTMAPFRSS